MATIYYNTGEGLEEHVPEETYRLTEHGIEWTDDEEGATTWVVPWSAVMKFQRTTVKPLIG
jgi:hypothetical protein